jgi:hypothetical protein
MHRLIKGKHNNLVMVLLLLAAAGLPYLNSLRCGFTYDNVAVVLEDERLRAPADEALPAIWTQDYWSPHILGLFRPVTTTTFWWNYRVLGHRENPEGYHVTNLGLHALNVILIFLLLRHLRFQPWLACLGGCFLRFIH